MVRGHCTDCIKWGLVSITLLTYFVYTYFLLVYTYTYLLHYTYLCILVLNRYLVFLIRVQLYLPDTLGQGIPFISQRNSKKIVGVSETNNSAVLPLSPFSKSLTGVNTSEPPAPTHVSVKDDTAPTTAATPLKGILRHAQPSPESPANTPTSEEGMMDKNEGTPDKRRASNFAFDSNKAQSAPPSTHADTPTTASGSCEACLELLELTKFGLIHGAELQYHNIIEASEYEDLSWFIVAFIFLSGASTTAQSVAVIVATQILDASITIVLASTLIGLISAVLGMCVYCIVYNTYQAILLYAYCISYMMHEIECVLYIPRKLIHTL